MLAPALQKYLDRGSPEHLFSFGDLMDTATCLMQASDDTTLGKGYFGWHRMVDECKVKEDVFSRSTRNRLTQRGAPQVAPTTTVVLLLAA